MALCPRNKSAGPAIFSSLSDVECLQRALNGAKSSTGSERFEPKVGEQNTKHPLERQKQEVEGGTFDLQDLETYEASDSDDHSWGDWWDGRATLFCAANVFRVTWSEGRSFPPFASDTSPKVIDLEGLGKRHRGTRQHNSQHDRQRNIMAFAKRCCPCLKPCQSKRRFIDEN